MQEKKEKKRKKQALTDRLTEIRDELIIHCFQDLRFKNP